MEKNKKIWIGAGCSIAILGIAATTGVLIWKNGQTSEVTYRETTVEYGNLTVGITEDSTVNIGTVSQTFDLDISALVSSDSSSSSSTSQNDSMGGMGMQMFSFGGDTYTSQSQEMVIDSVHITVGQEIQAGDVLYTLTEDSVEEIRTQLEEDVEDTLADYQALTVEQQQSYRLQNRVMTHMSQMEVLQNLPIIKNYRIFRIKWMRQQILWKRSRIRSMRTWKSL